jgi:hypothetical protein
MADQSTGSGSSASAGGGSSSISDQLRFYYFQTQSFLRRVIPTAFTHPSPHDFVTASASASSLLVTREHRPLASLVGQSYINADTLEADVRRDFEHLIWMTYRDEINPPLNGDTGSFSSDAGWGCMVRTIQMILAEAYRRHDKQSVLTEEWKCESLQGNDAIITKSITLETENGDGAGQKAVLVENGELKDGAVASSPVLNTPAFQSMIDAEKEGLLKNVVQKFLDIDDPVVAPFSIHRILQDKNPGRWFGPHEASMMAK